jgi:hypothetical protein
MLHVSSVDTRGPPLRFADGGSGGIRISHCDDTAPPLRSARGDGVGRPLG